MNSVRFCYTSFVMWLIISMYLSNAADAYRVYVFTALQVLCIVGFIYEVHLIQTESKGLNDDKQHLTYLKAARLALINTLSASPQEDRVSPSKRDEHANDIPEEENADHVVSSEGEPRRAGSVEASAKETAEASTKETVTPAMTKLGLKSMSLDTNAGELPSDRLARKLWSGSMYLSSPRLWSKLKTEPSMDIQDDKANTDKYMYGALYACIGMLIWKHMWIVQLLVLPVLYYIVKQLGRYFGFWDTIRTYYDTTARVVKSWCSERHQALLPSNIRGLCKILVMVDDYVRNVLKCSVDAVATCAVISGLIVFTVCASIFITLQVRGIAFENFTVRSVRRRS